MFVIGNTLGFSFLLAYPVNKVACRVWSRRRSTKSPFFDSRTRKSVVNYGRSIMRTCLSSQLRRLSGKQGTISFGKTERFSRPQSGLPGYAHARLLEMEPSEASSKLRYSYLSPISLTAFSLWPQGTQALISCGIRLGFPRRTLQS